MYSVYNHSSEFLDQTLKYWNDRYRKPGYNPGFENFGKHYTVKLGQCTDWYGYAHHGKSELLYEVCINLAERYDIKTAVRAPDVGRKEEITVDLAARYLKNPNPTEHDKHRALQWVQHYFQIVSAPRDKDGVPEEKSLVEFCRWVSEQEVQMGVIDSVNHLPLAMGEYGGRQDLTLRTVLNARNQMMHRSGQHMHCVWHLSGDAKVKRDGTFPKPHHNFTSGGREVGNFARAAVGVWRPDPETNETRFIVSKAKPKGIGVIGEGTLRYNVASGRYYEVQDLEQSTSEYHFYAYQKEDGQKEVYNPPIMEPNKDFDNEAPKQPPKNVNTSGSKPPF